MDKGILLGSLNDFLQRYRADEKDRIWQEQSAAFRKFWHNEVLEKNSGEISDERCDTIIRILDQNGKGNTKDSEAVARALVPQNVWRKLFNILHAKEKLAGLVYNIFKEENLNRQAELINTLYKENENEKNRLTGPSGHVLNAFLAAYDPVKNLSIISLNHRKAMLNFLEVKLPFDWESVSIGERIVQSNVLLVDLTKDLGKSRSSFGYCQSDRENS